jgi:hypothetical protein
MSRRYKKLQKLQRTSKSNRCTTKGIVAARIAERECRSDEEEHGEVFNTRRRARDRTKLRRHDGEHDGSCQQDPGDQAYDFSGGHRWGSRIARLDEPGTLTGQAASTPPISLPVRLPDQSGTPLKFLNRVDPCNIRNLRRLSSPPLPIERSLSLLFNPTQPATVHFAGSSITCILISGAMVVVGANHEALAV